MPVGPVTRRMHGDGDPSREAGGMELLALAVPYNKPPTRAHEARVPEGRNQIAPAVASALRSAHRNLEKV